MKPVNIILADDHVLVRQGIKKIIEENPQWRVVAEVGDGLELMDRLVHATPDVVVLDLSMPRLRGLEAAALIKKLYPAVKVLILTMYRDQDLFQRVMQVGVDGYVLKEEVDVDLQFALKSILEGKSYISPMLR